MHQFRIEKAKALLQSTDYKIQTVAPEVGYFDEAHFTRTFKKWVGMLPSLYKKDIAARGASQPSL
ncbi:helix-turn-helix domain-containing protein [Paenibacillus terrae]|uniref:helix-turn-helix domain-containing protein n=1 Tax=Paenibacillus terrae TaxID=159743 RepID=UPI00165688A1